MNWSTRLRRWVRIRMPPVREASTKPTAATVLPAPVACSNQKRRLAPGSSGASSTTSASSASRAPPSPGAPPRRGRARPRRRARRRRRCRFASPFGPRRPPRVGRWRAVRAVPRGSAASSISVMIAASVPESASTWWSLSSAPSSSVGALLVEQPLEAEQQRVLAAPLEARRLGAAVELGERGVDRLAPGGARGEVVDRLALEQDRLAGELAHPLEVGLAQLARPRARPRRWCQPWARRRRFPRSPLIRDGRGERSKLGRGGRRAEIPSGRTGIPPRSEKQRDRD